MNEQKWKWVTRTAGAVGLVLAAMAQAADGAAGPAAGPSTARGKAAFHHQALAGDRTTNVELRHFAVYADFHAIAATPDDAVFLTTAGVRQALPTLGGQRGMEYFACPHARDGM